MKRTLSMITLAVLTIGLLGSCSKINERIDNLEKKVDGLENEKIASIQTQIDNIGNSISDLGTIRSNIQALTDKAKAQGEDITALQAADKALDSRIGELSKYVGDTLKAYATEEWARATFATLEQYRKTCDTIAEIEVRIGELDADLTKKIADCADSLTTWINVKFEGYYTAAQMDAKLALMKSAVDSAKAAGEITDAKADSLAGELAKVQPAIDSAKASLTAEYTAAIDTAINALDGKLTKQIQDEIEKVNETVAALAQRVGILEFQVRDLLGRVEALEGMIQSVTIVPAYSDGSVKVENDSLHIDCIITPASATRWLGIGNFTILVKGVAGTKAGVETIGIKSPWDLKIDRAKGTASMKVKIADRLPGNDSSLAVAINVKDNRNGSDYTTEFVPVYAVPPVPYVEIAAQYDGSTITTLKWYRQNLAITASGNKKWQGGNSTAVKVPGTKDDVIVGDYFQWAASYKGYDVQAGNEKPDSLLIYTSFINKGCGDEDDKFSFRLAGEGNTYQFSTSTSGTNIGISPYYNGSAYTKYTKTKNASGDGNELLKSPDDVASIILGGDWRMPTSAEFKAMKAATYWKWDATDEGYYVYTPVSGDEGGLNGKQSDKTTDVTGTYNKSDALLFFPAAGSGIDSGLKNTGSYGYYWSSSYYSGSTYTTNAYRCYFSLEEGVMPQNYAPRNYGFSVRPVSE